MYKIKTTSTFDKDIKKLDRPIAKRIFNKAIRILLVTNGLILIAGALGAVAGGFLAVKFGFNAMFITMGLLCFASAIYIFRLPRRVL